jgi:hypothetical protein
VAIEGAMQHAPQPLRHSIAASGCEIAFMQGHRRAARRACASAVARIGRTACARPVSPGARERYSRPRRAFGTGERGRAMQEMNGADQARAAAARPLSIAGRRRCRAPM